MARNYTALTVYFTKEQISKLKEYSVQSKVNVSELIRTAVDRLLVSEIPTWK